MIAERIHLFPYRTQKLSFLTPKVLVGSLTGRIGNCHFLIYPFQGFPVADFFCVVESLQAPPKKLAMQVISIRPIVESLQAIPPKSYAIRVIVRLQNRYGLFYPKTSSYGLPRMRASFSLPGLQAVLYFLITPTYIPDPIIVF